MAYTITSYTKRQARKHGVSVKPTQKIQKKQETLMIVKRISSHNTSHDIKLLFQCLFAASVFFRNERSDFFANNRFFIATTIEIIS